MTKNILLCGSLILASLGAQAQCAPDVTAPTAICQDITVYLDGTGNVTVPATSVDNASTDFCALASVYFAKPIKLVITAVNSDQVWTSDPDGSNMTVLYNSFIGQTEGPVGIEYEPTNDLIYVPGGNTSEITIADAFGGGGNATLPNASGMCCEHHDLDIDAANNRMFFTASGGGLYSGNLDGTGTAVQIYDNSGQITGVEYDAINDKVIICDLGNNEIVSMNPDGTGAVVLYDNADGVSGPRQVALDPATNRVWWTNRDTDEIYDGTLDGLAAANVTWGGQSGIYGIHFDPITNGLLWVTFGANDEVHSGASDGSGVITTLISGSYGGFRDVTIAGSTTPALSLDFDCNDVGANNVQLVALDVAGNTDTCSAIVTVLDTISPVANCQDATVYIDNAGNGSTQENLIFYSTVSSGSIWSISPNGGTASAVVASAGSHAIGLDYDSGNIYWGGGQSYSISTADVGVGTGSAIANSNTGNFNPTHDVAVDAANSRYFYTVSYDGVYVANLNGTGGQTQLAFANSKVTGVAYDPVGDKVYYVDESDEVYSMDANGANNTLLYDFSDGVSTPRQIDIDPNNNRLWITNNGSGDIMMGSMDGVSTLTSIYSGESGPFGIDYEPVSDILYWATQAGDVRKGPADGSGNAETIASGINGLRGIKAEIGIGAILTDNGSTDNCGNLTITTVPATFDCTDVGSTVSVTTTVTDESGNSSSCISNVTIADSLGPVIDCLGEINALANAANCGATVTWIAPTAVDNCAGTITWTSSHNPGDTFPHDTTTVTYTATDASGNSSDCSFDVIVSTDLSVTVTQVDVLCLGDTTGSIDVTPIDGTAPYTYDWDIDGLGDFDDTEDLINLGAGDYTGELMDANGCTTGGTVTITEPATAVEITLGLVGYPSCGSSDGTINVSLSGGTAGYTYDWDNDGTGDFDDTEDLTGLAPGNYTLISQDANSCPDTIDIILTSVGGPFVVDNSTNPSCPGVSDGAIDITVSSGTAPYTYDWDTDGTGDYDDAEDLTGLAAGTYTVYVKDAGDCISALSVTLSDPAGMTLTSSITHELAGSDGEIDLTVSGGTSPYTFDWDNDGTGDTDDTEDLTGLTAGTYTVEVADANGCTETLVVTVNSQLSIADADFSYSVYPNPTNGMVTIDIEGNPLNASINILSLDGKLIQSTSVNQEKIKLDLNGLSKGIYIIELTGNDYKIPTRIILQ
jgi:HYR domain/Secretion system C-terminal sorting domain/SprB repeat